MLRARGIEPRIVDYLHNPPDAQKLREITRLLGCSIGDIMRRGEKLYGQVVPEGASPEERLIDLVARHPILLERPIVFHNGRAAVGRPPENVLKIFDE
ncbi:MAG: arsenate reductase (glutaredoxin) [Gammaproteobacteria bacterium]|nr:arsenate reductase (glutaredoxin) [Gammaproteobacteria bacterium]